MFANKGQLVSLLLMPHSVLLQAVPLPCPLPQWWMEVQSVSVVSTGGGVTNARSAVGQPSASTGGCVTAARSAAAQASASTGGSVTDARSAAAQASASMGRGRVAARNALPSEILRGSTQLLLHTRPRKLPRGSTRGACTYCYHIADMLPTHETRHIRARHVDTQVTPPPEA